MKSKRNNFIKIYLNDDEFNAIMENAEMANLSLSTFGRKMCLGTPIESNFDRGARLELIRLRGDVGKLGGLMKQGLSFGVDKKIVYQVLREFDSVKADIKSVLDKI